MRRRPTSPCPQTPFSEVLDAASTVPAEFEQREGVALVCDVCVLGPRALVGADADRLLCKDSTRNPPWMWISEELPSRHLQRADFILACAYLHLDWPGALGCCTLVRLHASA